MGEIRDRNHLFNLEYGGGYTLVPLFEGTEIYLYVNDYDEDIPVYYVKHLDKYYMESFEFEETCLDFSRKELKLRKGFRELRFIGVL